MRRLFPCLFLLPLLSSCMVQEGYYEPGYYPPPPPRAEMHRYGHQSHGYRPTSQDRLEQGRVHQPQVRGQSGQHRHDEHQNAQQRGNVVVEHD